MASGQEAAANSDATRSGSIPQDSQLSQTAQEFINAQLQLEEDAREALPYQFDTCTHPLGPLRQTVFSCLTCRPPPEDPSKPYDAAGVCYSCSISCHGDHELVELFTRRNFVCDCGTKRLPTETPCALRVNPDTGKKGNVHSQEPSATNRYNQNFRNRFCGCSEIYDPQTEKATMFQCIGLGDVEDGGCGEDWWHPECILGLPRDWYKKPEFKAFLRRNPQETKGVENNHAQENDGLDVDQDSLLPSNFPDEDDFEHLVCHKCLEAFPWMKRYANAPGFTFAHLHDVKIDAPNENRALTPDVNISTDAQVGLEDQAADLTVKERVAETASTISTSSNLKRKAEDGERNNDDVDSGAETRPAAKKIRSEDEDMPTVDSNTVSQEVPCCNKFLPPSSQGHIALFLQEDFRDQLCRCKDCFPKLSRHPQLLEEEENYEPPLSTSSANRNGSQPNGTQSVGSRSLLDRGEAALSSMDRVRAIEGVMVYNHLRDKVKDFLKPFAKSGTAVGAEDIKKYFEKLRGDEDAIKAAAAGTSDTTNGAKGGGEGGESSDGRKEQRGC